MKHMKRLSLAMFSVMALMSFAGLATASAAIETSPAGTSFTGEIVATASSSLLLKAGFANITCTSSTIAGTTGVSTVSFSNCNATVDVLRNGAGETHGEITAPHVKVTGKSSEVTVSVLGTSCVYGTAGGTTLGTGIGGTPATVTVSASLPKISGGFACGNPASFSGSYTITQPSTLLFD